MKIDDKNRGTKTIDVVVAPEGTSATITIKGRGRLFGEAFFKDANGKDVLTTTAAGTKTLTLYGGSRFSREPRDAFLEATIGNAVAEIWDFTVFYVRMQGFTEGEASAVLPATVTNYQGQKLIDRVNRALTDPNNPGKHLLGHHLVTPRGQDGEGYGAIIVRGQIVPSKMNRADFNISATRSRSGQFNMDRWIEAREYNRSGCFDAGLTGVDGVSSCKRHR